MGNQGRISGALHYPFARFWHNVERQRERELYSDVHAALYRLGFTHQISFYGTTTEPYDGQHYQARIEIVTRQDFTPKLVRALHKAFDHFKPDREYTLFVLEGRGLRQIVCQ